MTKLTTRLFPQLSDTAEEALLKRLQKTLREHNIDDNTVEWVKDTLYANKAKYAPYHNNVHTALAIIGALDIIATIPERTPHDTNTVLVAALFHDYNHLEVATDDNINIDEAITAIYEEFNKPHPPKILETLTPKFVTKIVRKTNIQTTLNPDSKHYLYQTILRDADLIGWRHKKYQTTLMEGLSQELGRPITLTSTALFLQQQTIHHAYTREQLHSFLNPNEKRTMAETKLTIDGYLTTPTPYPTDTIIKAITLYDTQTRKHEPNIADTIENVAEEHITLIGKTTHTDPKDALTEFLTTLKNHNLNYNGTIHAWGKTPETSTKYVIIDSEIRETAPPMNWLTGK